MWDIIGPNLDITASVTMKRVMTEFVYVLCYEERGGGH